MSVCQFETELSVKEEKIWTDDIHSNEKLVTSFFKKGDIYT